MSADDEPVGYGKPPLAGRFTRGKSGNPRGRPKGTRNLKTDLEAELQETIQIRVGDRPARVTKQRAMVKSLMAGSLNGDRRAANSLLAMIYRLIDHSAAAEPDAPLEADDEAMIEAALARRAAAGSAEPPPISPTDPRSDPDDSRASDAKPNPTTSNT